MRERTKRREGTVVSAKMRKTVVVQVERLVQHPLYGDYRIAADFAAHAMAREPRDQKGGDVGEARGPWCRCGQCSAWRIIRAPAK